MWEGILVNIFPSIPLEMMFSMYMYIIIHVAIVLVLWSILEDST